MRLLRALSMPIFFTIAAFVVVYYNHVAGGGTKFLVFPFAYLVSPDQTPIGLGDTSAVMIFAAGLLLGTWDLFWYFRSRPPAPAQENKS